VKRPIPVVAAAGWLLVALPADVALAQKPGGILKMYDADSPASGIVNLSRGGMLLRSVARWEVLGTPIELTPSQPRGAEKLTSTPLS
jgi:hypothetical protein